MGGNSLPLVIAGVSGVIAAIILVVGVLSLRREREAVVEARLGRYTDLTTLSTQITQEEEEDKKKKEEKTGVITERLEKALKGRKFAEKWRTKLARADLKLKVSEYFMLHIISVVVFFLVGWQIIFKNPLLGVVAGVIGFFAPGMYVANRQRARLHAFENQLPDTLSLWVNALRSGYSVQQAMEAIAREAPEPTATEFHRVVREVQLGVPMETALDNLLRRVSSDDMDLVVTAVKIQREVGGNLAEILEVISHTIRERIKLKGEIRVLTAQGRITGYLIGGLPIVLALFLYVINPGYMGLLFQDQCCGWPMIGVGLALIGMGAAAISKIVDIEY